MMRVSKETKATLKTKSMMYSDYDYHYATGRKNEPIMRKYSFSIRLDFDHCSFGMQIVMMASLICLSAISYASGALVPVRLVGGPTVYEGRLEVFYNESWGTVCDDQMNDKNCVVVCKQLGYQGGLYVPNAVGRYGMGTGITWLDDLNCSGFEPDLDACLHRFWGDSDCKHIEDTGCKCSPSVPSNVLPPAGTCMSNRHHIRAFDPNYPGIGRAEVLGNDGSWYVICDDFWDDVDAAVFCQCLGYTDKAHFRAYWSSDLINMTPELNVLYGSVHCTVAEMNTVQNIWQCLTSPNTGQCDLKVEAAAVACQALPPITPQAPPAAHLDCDGEQLTVCFTSTDYALYANYIDLDPSCAHSRAMSIEDGVCIIIPMHKCIAADIQTDFSSKHYCYDVLYSESSTMHDLTVGSWVRSACCSLAKNGTVQSSFIPHVQDQDQISTASHVNFTINCYLNDSFSGQALEFPANISRGQDMYCMISAAVWDPTLWLVVPDCRFMARVSGSPSYTFVNGKCPTSQEFGINYYSFDGHNWGFKFRTPQFEGYDDLFLSCDCYVCDPTLDSKPYCDRTCRSDRTRRHAPNHILHRVSLREVTNGPFHIHDSLNGPLISQSGELMYAGGDYLDRTINIPRHKQGPIQSSAAMRKAGLLVFWLLLCSYI